MTELSIEPDLAVTPARSRPHVVPQLASALAAGAVFGFGLALSSMIRPSVVLSFLRFQDFGLMLVLGTAVVVALPAYRFMPRILRRPLLGGQFHTHQLAPMRSAISGAAIFGIGWGLTGVCPGPAIAGLGAGSYELLYALAGLALGALVHGMTSRSS